MAKPGFLFYFDRKYIFSTLSPAEQGTLLMAALTYAETGQRPQFTDRIMSMAWNALWPRLDEDARRYESIVQSKRAAANKRWDRSSPETTPPPSAPQRSTPRTPKSPANSAFKSHQAIDDGMDQYLNW